MDSSGPFSPWLWSGREQSSPLSQSMTVASVMESLSVFHETTWSATAPEDDF